MSMIESDRLAPPRPGWVPPSVPSTRIVVGVDVNIPLASVSCASTDFGTRSFAPEMPCENDR